MFLATSPCASTGAHKGAIVTQLLGKKIHCNDSHLYIMKNKRPGRRDTRKFFAQDHKLTRKHPNAKVQVGHRGMLGGFMSTRLLMATLPG